MLGRENEVAEIARILEQARGGTAGALLLCGPAGIGKTTLLDAACARAPDFERVRIAGFEAEADLGWSGLATLLLAWPALDEGPQHALLHAAVGGARCSTVAAGAALHALVTRRSERAPVLLAIDDAQWLDPASVATIAFAVHRFAADRVAVLIAQRDDAPGRFAGVPERSVGGLATAPCRTLVATRFALPPAVADRCIEVTGGNPLALLHLCEALARDPRSGERPIDAAIALPDRLASVFAAKIATLPAATQRALAVLAAGSESGPLDAALGAVDAQAGDWLAAEAVGIVALDGRPHFAHPLWSAAVLDFVGPALRRRVHRALAAHASDPDRAALHRAAGAERADERIARDLDALAERSIERGLPATAARAWTDAAQLSESADARRRRELAAAHAFWDASMLRSAVEMLERVIRAVTEPRARAEAVLMRNQIRAFTEDARGAALALRAEAERVRADVPELESPLLAAATVAALLAADAPLGLEVASRAVACASDEPSRVTARALCGYAAVHLGDGSHAEAVRAMEQLGGAPAEAFGDAQIELLQLAGYVLLVRERWDEADRTLRGVIAAASRRGLASIEAFSNALLAELEFRRGRWLDALTGATVDIALNEARAENRAALGHAVAAHVFAHLGETEPCELRARHALRSSESLGLASIAAFARCALGASALARGDTAAAARELGAVWEIRTRGGVAEAGVVWYHADLVEALVAEGRNGEAAEIVRDVARNAEATGGKWAASVAARGRALLGRGSARDAIAAAAAVGAPFELARTQLALVEHGRSDARAAGLDDALATFERLGARPWAVRARGRLGAAGESVPSLAQQLTDAELRVAMLVGRGATNAAASEQLAISVRTVDAHLRSIFRKLGLKTRSELVLRVVREAGA